MGFKRGPLSVKEPRPWDLFLKGLLTRKKLYYRAKFPIEKFFQE